jgi:hypothetical protein
VRNITHHLWGEGGREGERGREREHRDEKWRAKKDEKK